DINQPKESPTRTPQGPGIGGLLLGTDFRHAVEFSRSGRAATRPFRVFVTGDFPTVRRSRGCSPGGFSAAREGLGGATDTKVHDPERGLQGGGPRARRPRP